VENLEAFAWLIGYIRFFYPSDQAAKADWDNFAIANVEGIEAAKDDVELARLLQNAFQPVAPLLKVFPTGTEPGPLYDDKTLALIKSAQKLELVAWRHTATEWTALPQDKTVRRYMPVKFGKTPRDFANPLEPFRYELPDNVSCVLPLSLYANENGRCRQ
jgi:hypothetical protein